MAARAALRPRLDALHRAADWQPESAGTAPLALGGAVGAADLARALLSAVGV